MCTGCLASCFFKRETPPSLFPSFYSFEMLMLSSPFLARWTVFLALTQDCVYEIKASTSSYSLQLAHFVFRSHVPFFWCGVLFPFCLCFLHPPHEHAQLPRYVNGLGLPLSSTPYVYRRMEYGSCQIRKKDICLSYI